MAENIVMPDLGMDMQEGLLINWTKQPGDSINPGDVIAEVETDKTTVEVQTTVGGTILDLIGEPGQNLRVGSVIGHVGAAGEQPAASGNGGGAPASAPVGEAPPRAGQQPTPQEASAAPTQEGANTSASPGGRAQQPASAGTGGGAPSGGSASGVAQADSPEHYGGTAGPQDVRAITQPTPDRNGNGNGAPAGENGRVKASPVARKMAEERGIDLGRVHGTGPDGRITKADIEGFTPEEAPAAPRPAATGGQPAPDAGSVAATPSTVQPSIQIEPGQQPPAIAPATYGPLPTGPDVEIVDVSKLRARIGSRMVQSKQQVPHFYVTSEIEMDALMALRAQLNSTVANAEDKISVNDFIVKGVALTLRDYPNLNSHFYGDKLAIHKRINIGIAVALDNGGLINVVAKDADKTAIGAMARLNRAMVQRARDGKVKPDDLSGSTFTVSNLGMYDVDNFIAIVNPPEAGILAIGSAKKVPVVQPDGTLGVGTRMKATVSVDHRVGNGAEAGEFMRAFKTLLENPLRLLM